MLNKSKEWIQLEEHKSRVADVSLRQFFTADEARHERFGLQVGALYCDYSRNLIDQDVFDALLQMARAREVEAWRDKMFSGVRINNSEDRAVLHVALRAPDHADFVIEGDDEDLMAFIPATRRQMKAFADAVHSSQWTGHTGKQIKSIVNIGIGGSDLGPRMVSAALTSYHVKNLSVHYVSNVDEADLHNVLLKCDPETTLFLVVSKTFTTQETMTNAQSAKAWLLEGLGSDETATQKHFAAVSTNIEAALNFGIAADNIFPMRDWTGGRFSLWSSVGLSIALAVGFDNFQKLLDGAYEMDEHFKSAPLEKNMPVILGMLGIWYRNFWNAQSYAVLPYAQLLSLFSDWLQQLDMESNGKRVSRDNQVLDYDTGPAVFGQPGTNGQHAFYQMIHQGTSLVPCEFIGVKNTAYDKEHHKILCAHMAAQAQALAFGRAVQDDCYTKEFTGNKPSTSIVMEDLSPHSLGMLIALYEHKIFVQGIVWGINSFDQWGVELGKTLAKKILDVDYQIGNSEGDMDSATLSVLKKLGVVS